MADLQNSFTGKLVFQVFLTGTATPATGETVAIQISKNGGAFGNPSAGATNLSEIGLGWYYWTPSAIDTGTNGPLIIQGTCTGCDNVNEFHYIVSATNGRLSALPATAATTNASLLTSGTGTDQLSVASGVVTANVSEINSVSTSSVTTVDAVIGTTSANTPQTGDSYALANGADGFVAIYGRLGAPTGASVSADIASVETKLGSPAGASVSADIASIETKLGSPAGASVSADIATAVSDITTVTSNLSSDVSTLAGDITSAVSTLAGDITSAVSTLAGDIPSASTIATAVLTTAMTEAYPTQGATFSLAKGIYQLVQQTGQMSISGTTMTVLKRDEATTAKTFTLNSATTPTAISETT